ncbi:unnamed protein product [Trichobilharzia szidati]|nr:unnamed protein product [Trichobilharzia szidati]
MSEKKRKHRLAGDKIDDDPLKPSPDEISIANYLHKKLPSKEARLSGMIVRVFVAMEAIELLMESPWAKLNNDAKPYLFTSQTAAVNFMTNMFQKQMFQRAVRIKKKSSKHREETKSSKSKVVKKLVDGKPVTAAAAPANAVAATASKATAESSPNGNAVVGEESCDSQPAKSSLFSSITSSINEITSSKSSSSSGGGGGKKPMRLEVVDEQIFTLDDPHSFYIWIYEPPPGLFNWLAGTALIIGIILCCLFPIWPSELRQGAYYLTITVSGFLGVLFFIGFIRFCLYLLVWLFTLGQYNFWLFPNYCEDCGFFDSFRPLYSLKHVSEAETPVNKKSKSKVKSSSNNNSNSNNNNNNNSTSSATTLSNVCDSSSSSAKSTQSSCCTEETLLKSPEVLEEEEHEQEEEEPEAEEGEAEKLKAKKDA